MSRAQQQPYALQLRKQYVDGRNLNARFELQRRFSTKPFGWTRWVFDQMALPSGARVLELGCGTGLLWKTNLTRVSPTWRMTLSDFSLGMLREARANLDRASLQISFARLDAEALPFGDGSFDAVIANHMLYHVEDRDRVISQVGRVLAPGGTFYAATNGLAHLRELDRIVERFMAGRSPLEDNVERFGLETGGTQLRRHFGAVELRRYNDSLVVYGSAAAGRLRRIIDGRADGRNTRRDVPLRRRTASPAWQHSNRQGRGRVHFTAIAKGSAGAVRSALAGQGKGVANPIGSAVFPTEFRTRGRSSTRAITTVVVDRASGRKENRMCVAQHKS